MDSCAISAAENNNYYGLRSKKFDELLYQLKQLRDAQEDANENVHENFRNTTNFEESLERVTKMDEAIDILDGIY